MSGLKPLAHSLNMLARPDLRGLEIHAGTIIPPALITTIDDLVTALPWKQTVSSTFSATPPDSFPPA